MIGARTPKLAGLWASLDDANGIITLRHQDLGTLSFKPDTEEAAFLDWIAPLCPEDRARPKAIVKAEGRGMTDTDFPSVSIMNIASHNAVTERLGTALEQERWRGNIWLSGLPAWDEFGWIDKTLRLGEAEFKVRERIVRCMHTTANPVTGERDQDTLGALEAGWGHKDFGVCAEVIKGGKIALGATAEVL
jgi:uncharacterized protein YcbX